MKHALLLLALPLAGLADEWRSVEGSRFTFQASFEGEPLPAEFREFDVVFTGDELTVSVDLTKADMGDPDMNAILFDPMWFGAEAFKRADYRATRIDCNADDRCTAYGELDLKGTKQAVTVPFEWTVDGEQASLRGGLVINRSRFNVGSGEWSTGESIGLDVKLEFDLVLERVE